ncbi:hypothetical protein [Hamadaea tsunoensis]|uniref:hypothetical protein n=1 Tax=Hamadaea tsunoensis TaxID=53368 RepID=UPI0004159B47|nr:hypothetical protein [Hamadaea tsunoensis]
MKIGARGKIGWLLRANRTLTDVHHKLRSGKEFARLFRADGESALAPSHITRWEQGGIAVSRATVRRYERLLDLRPESLVTVCDAVARTEVVREESADPRTGEERERDLKELLDRALSGAVMTGLDWSSMAEIVRSTPGLFLFPTENWALLTGRLLEELVVSDHAEWLLRQEAMSKLLEHPYAGVHAVQSCISLVEDRASAAVLEPMSLLDVSASPSANAYILGQLAKPDDQRVLYGAAVAARQKLLRGHFDAAQVRGLLAAAAQRMKEGAAGDTLTSLRLLVQGVREPPPRTHVAEISTRVALQVHGAMAAEREDPLLVEMIDEALFGIESDARMVAAMCLAATPYRAHVGTALLAEIQAGLVGRDEDFPRRALRTLTTLAVDVHRPLILRILTTPGFNAGVREAAAWALPHCAGRYAETTWRGLLAAYGGAWRRTPSDHLGRVLHGIAYGIGTDDYHGLTEEIRTDPSLPLVARRTAGWLGRTRRAG